MNFLDGAAPPVLGMTPRGPKWSVLKETGDTRRGVGRDSVRRTKSKKKDCIKGCHEKDLKKKGL